MASETNEKDITLIHVEYSNTDLEQTGRWQPCFAIPVLILESL